MIGLLLVSLSLGLSNFAAAIGIGVGGASARTRLQTGLAFGLFEAGMPILGLVIGRTFAAQLAATGHLVGGILLVATGSYAIWRGRREGEGNPASRGAGRLRFGPLLLMGLALSLDNLVVGFALSLAGVAILPAAGLIAIVSVSLALVGLELGERLGRRFEAWSAEIGGAVLVLVGLALTVGVL